MEAAVIATTAKYETKILDFFDSKVLGGLF
jgi:hypothetical protein